MKQELIQSGTACVYLLVYLTNSVRPSPSVFTYCKQSNTGGGNGLGMRLKYGGLPGDIIGTCTNSTLTLCDKQVPFIRLH